MEKKTIIEIFQECKLKQEMEQKKKEVFMEKKTIIEIFQECKLKQEMEQKKKELLLAQLAKDFFDPLGLVHHLSPSALLNSK